MRYTKLLWLQILPVHAPSLACLAPTIFLSARGLRSTYGMCRLGRCDTARHAMCLIVPSRDCQELPRGHIPIPAAQVPLLCHGTLPCWPHLNARLSCPPYISDRDLLSTVPRQPETCVAPMSHTQQLHLTPGASLAVATFVTCLGMRRH